jgi:Na+/melibiose symporter-like transporter
MAAILPVEVRGRFFATDHALTSGLGVGTLLLCAALFARFPGWTAFALVYGLALTGSVLAVASLLRLPSAAPPAPVALRALPREALRLCVAPGLFRFYLALALLSWSANAALAPFIAYYLKVEAGVPEQRILVFTAAQFAGQIAASSSIRAAIDRVPLRRFFQLAALGFLGVALFWLAVVRGAGAGSPLVAVAYFVFGGAAGVSNAAHNTLLPELSEASRRPVAIAVFTSLLGVVAGLAPIAWGLLLKAPGPGPGLQLGRFGAFFAVAAAANALLVLAFQRLPERRAAAT